MKPAPVKREKTRNSWKCFITIAAVIVFSAALCAKAGEMTGATASFFPQADVLTLNQALRLGLQNNTAVLSAEQDVIIAQQRVKEAVFLFFPQTTLTGTATKSNLKYPQLLIPESASHIIYPSDYENFYTARASFLQPIYVGGKNTSTLRLAQAALKQAQASYDSARRDAMLSVRESFYKLLHSSATLTARENWLFQMREITQKAGLSSWEGLESEAALETMTADQETAMQKHRTLKLELLRSLNKELDSVVDISGEFIARPNTTDLSKLTVWAMEMRPELKSEVVKAEMDAIAVNLAMARRLPTVMLGASYDVVGAKFPLNSNSWETTLAIQLPLSYDFWTQITQKRAEQRQGDLKRSELQDRVRLQIRQAYDDNSFWQGEAVAREASYRKLERRYTEVASQAAPSLAALRAAREVFVAQLVWLDAVREQLLSRARLEWALGQDIPAQ